MLSRRDALKLAGVAATAPLLERLSVVGLHAAAEGRQIAGYDPALLVSRETLASWLKQLHDFGPIRMTGTPQARAFEEWLAAQMMALGYGVERIQYRLTSWECRVEQCAVDVTEDSGARRSVEIVSYYPFGGSTSGRTPVSGRVLFVPGVGVEAARALAASTDPAILAASIVVMDMPLARQAPAANGGAAAAPASGPLARFPLQPPPRAGGPSPAGQGGRDIMEVFEHKCRGLVLCYTDVTNDTARHTYLPFSDQHRTLPAVWVGADGSAYLKSVSGKATVSLRCDATLTPDARADTIVATLNGQRDECVLLTTQTDGPNEVNENGALGVLAVATYWSKLPIARRPRTIVCSLPTGHYAAGAIADTVSGSGKRAGTRGVIEQFPEMIKRVVGHLSLEQMGAMEWAQVEGQYVATGNVAGERWIPTHDTVDASKQLFMASTSGEDPRFSNAAVVEGGAPGEGGSLRSLGIPGFGLMGQPSYFFRADPKGVLEKISPDVMRNQIAFATKLTVLMSRLAVDQLRGKAPISDADLFG